MPEPTDLNTLLMMNDTELDAQWNQLTDWLTTRFGRHSEMESILFLIGIQERGQGHQPQLDKDAKQALIMEGSYAAFEMLGYYNRVGLNEDGAWIWERIKRVPVLDVEDQEKLLRLAVLKYFEPLLEDIAEGASAKAGTS